MKKSVFIFITTLCSSTFFAQTSYFPSGMMWKSNHQTFCGESSEDGWSSGIHEIRVEGDTLIGGIAYQLIGDYPVRAEGKRIYCRIKPDGVTETDVLLYDFGLEVGGKITQNYYENPTPDYATVTAVDYVTLPDGRQAKRLYYDNRGVDIEYIGAVSESSSGLFNPLSNLMPPCARWQFLCCSLNGEPLYEATPGGCSFSSDAYLSGLCQTFYTKAYACGGYTTVPNCSFDIDTLIQGKHYVCVIPPVMYETRLFLHQEGRRIYARPEYQQEEFLLFDFSLNVGDTVPYLYRYYDRSSGHWHFKYRTPDDWVYIDENIPADTVVSVSETTLQNGETRRMYRTSQKQIFVEGFGTLAKGLFGTLSSGEEACGTEFGLLCCSRNDAPLYTMSEASFRRLGLQGDECRCFETPVLDALEQVGVLQLSVSPNPVHDYLELQGLGKEAAVAIYDLSGQCLLRTASRRIDVSDLSQGIYLLQAVTTDGLHCQTKFLKE